MRYKDEITKQKEYFSSLNDKEKKFWLGFASEFKKDNEILSEILIEQELFYMTHSSEVEFIVFQSRINTLMLYLKKSKEFVDEFIKHRRKWLSESLAKNISGEYIHLQSEAFYEIENYFPEYLFISINGILYSILETTLKNIALLIGEKENKKLVLSRDRKPTLHKYIDFITKIGNFEIELPNDFWKDIELIRKIRNQFTHYLNDEMLNQLKGYDSQNEASYKEYLTFDFCMYNISVICEVIEEIETKVCGKYS